MSYYYPAWDDRLFRLNSSDLQFGLPGNPLHFPVIIMEEAKCFKCQCVFASQGALELHLMSCTAYFDPRRSTPWAFIPPPETYGRSHESQYRHQKPQGRRQPAHRMGSGAVHPSPETRMNGENRRRRRFISSNATGAECTQCGISFPDARSLGEHFIESPAHPYSVRAAPSNRRDPPVASKAQPIPKDRPASSAQRKEGRRTLGDVDSAKTSIKCECGRAFKTDSALAQHKRNSSKHKGNADGSVETAKRDGNGGLPGPSSRQVGGGDRVDDVTSAFAKLHVATVE